MRSAETSHYGSVFARITSHMAGNADIRMVLQCPRECILLLSSCVNAVRLTVGSVVVVLCGGECSGVGSGARGDERA